MNEAADQGAFDALISLTNATGQAMAKADDTTSTTDWIWLREALALAEALGSVALAKKQLTEWLEAGKIRWRRSAVHPSGASVDGFWEKRVAVDWGDNNATKRELLPVLGFEGVTMYGIRVARADIEALLPGSSDEPPARNLKDWVAREAPRHPPRNGEEMTAYAKRLKKDVLLKDPEASPKLREVEPKSIAARLYELKLGPRR